MTTAELEQTLRLLGVDYVNGTLKARCPVCQPFDTDPRDWHLLVNPGACRPIVFFCTHCHEVGNAVRNRKAFSRIVTAAALNFDWLNERMDSGEVRRLWADAKLGSLSDSGPPPADPDCLHSVYSGLLHQLELTDGDRRWLEKRGLDADWAFAAGYRSTPGSTQTDAGLHGGLHSGAHIGTGGEGTAAAGQVPGLVDGSWRFRHPAILHPCRDCTGRICAIKQRRMNVEHKSQRMRLLSSRHWGGPQALSIVHCPLGVGAHRWQELWIAEGERKGDVNWVRTDRATVCIPGANQWRKAIPVVQSLLERGGRAVLALDQDRAGRQSTPGLGRALQQLGFAVQLARWPAGKGLDDAVLRGRVEVGVFAEREAAQPPTILSTPHTAVAVATPRSILSPQGKLLTEDNLVEWVRRRGKVLRSEVPCRSELIGKAIRAGRLRIAEFTSQGQLLEVQQ